MEIPIIRIAVAESLGERVAGDLELGDPVVLVGRHGREFGLREDEGAKVLRLRGVLRPLVDVDDVEAGLVAVHGIQYDLGRGGKRKREPPFELLCRFVSSSSSSSLHAASLPLNVFRTTRGISVRKLMAI